MKNKGIATGSSLFCASFASMFKNQRFLGSLFVLLGAAFYGLLATVVKLAYHDDFTREEVIFSQFACGLIGLAAASFFVKRAHHPVAAPENRLTTRGALLLSGTTLGLTSLFYYTSIQTIPVSLGIVLLMQSVWMGVLVDWLLFRIRPSARKLVAVVCVLLGTVLATNVLATSVQVSWIGIGWGMLAALSYTGTLFASSRVGTQLHPIHKTMWLLLGGMFIVLPLVFSSLVAGFNWSIFAYYGPFLALFGTVLPPILFAYGMPKTGIGLGSILSAVEIPVSVGMAFLLLGEELVVLQWIGVVLILVAIVWMNLPQRQRT